MKTLTKLMLAIGVISLSACAINRESANFDPDKDMVKTDIVYVEHFEPDKRELNKIIADNMSTRGYTVTTGEKGNAPDNATVIVDYIDKWQWDMTNYMIELTITFRDPASGAAIASGNSYHTSLSRQSPQEMIDEVLANIFEADTAAESEPAE